MRRLQVAWIGILAPALYVQVAHAQAASCPPGSWTCQPTAVPSGPPSSLPAAPQAPHAPALLAAPLPPFTPPAQYHPVPQQPQAPQYYAPQPAIVRAQGYSAPYAARSYNPYNGPVGVRRDDREGLLLGVEGLGATDFSANPVAGVLGAGLKVGYRAHEVSVQFGYNGTYAQVGGVDRLQSDWVVSLNAYLGRSNPGALRPYVGGGLGYAVISEDAGRAQAVRAAYKVARLHFGYEWRMAPALGLQLEARGQFLGAGNPDEAWSKALPESSAQLFGVVGLVLYPGS